MTAYPPPPPPGAVPAPKAPPVAWLVPLAGVLGLLGAVLAWFSPVGTVDGQDVLTGENLHSWDDGRIGLIGPILLVVAGAMVAQLLFGRTVRRFSGANPLASAGKWSLVAGAVAIVCAAVAWFLLPGQYKIDGPNGQKLSWDAAIKLAKGNGVTLTISRGPQLGFWLTIVGALVAIAGGALLLVAGRRAAAATPPVPPPPPPFAQPYAQPYAQPAQPYAPPAQPYAPPSLEK